jgi:hypothetical protein
MPDDRRARGSFSSRYMLEREIQTPSEIDDLAQTSIRICRGEGRRCLPLSGRPSRQRASRPGKDFEAPIDSARAFLYAASVMLLVRRIARASITFETDS